MSTLPSEMSPEGPPQGLRRSELYKLRTIPLLALARTGDPRARDVLMQRYRPRLFAWVHGRLPIRARDCHDTDDIVQESLVRALNKLEGFEPRHEGAFLGLLRTTARHLVVDKIRQADRRPREEMGDHHVDPGLSPLDQAIGKDNLRRYEAALGRMPEDYAVAIHLRLEFQYSYAEMAAAMDRPTENAARLLVQRAMKRLAREMHERSES